MEKMAFDSEKYLTLQKENILKRMKMFGSKLYIEFGGKLFDDLHASRVLPGYKPNNKIKLLESLKEDSEVLFCINANDIESNKIRADHGITYSQDVLRVIDELRKLKITCNSVVITMFNDQPNAIKFANLLKINKINVYFNKPITMESKIGLPPGSIDKHSFYSRIDTSIKESIRQYFGY